MVEVFDKDCFWGLIGTCACVGLLLWIACIVYWFYIGGLKVEELRQALIESILTNGRKSEITVWISQYLDKEIVKEMRKQNGSN